MGRRTLAGLIFGLLLVVSFAAAQVRLGSIAGTVYDPTGAVVPGAEVTATDNGTNATLAVKTGNSGTFTIPGLTFGTYTVRVVAPGFAKWETNNVKVITAQEANVNATLQLGGANEVVTVEAAQTVIETTSTELVTHVDRLQIIDLPSLSRNPFDFATQMAGVTSTGSATSGSSIMNGLRGSSNVLTQDGIDIRDSFIKTSGFSNNSGYGITLESVGEFSISGQNVGADSGDGVVQVRIVTQRGANRLKGSLFYSGRNDAFNANSFRNNYLGQKKSMLHQHRFGGSVGGPISIPKLYNGKDRSFFFFQFSGFRENFGSNLTGTVLGADARNGIFKYTDSKGAIQSVNLLTASSRKLGINPFTQSLVGATPLPAAGNGMVLVPTTGDQLNTFGVQFKINGSDPSNQYDMRFDHKLLESQTLGTHWLEVNWHWMKSSYAPDGPPNFPKGISPNCYGAVCNVGDNETDKGRLFSIALNSTLTPTTFNELRAGFNRPSISFLAPEAFPRAFKVAFPTITNPEVNWDNQGRLSPFYMVSDNVTKVKGTHTIKTGVLVSSASTHRFNDWANISGISGGIVPTVTLGTTPGNDNGLASCPASTFPNLPTGSTGTTLCSRAQGIYAGLVGLVSNISQTFNAVPGKGFIPGLSDEIWLKERSYNFYVQNSWRVKPKLTFNYGVRWELVPAVDIANKRGLVPSNKAADVTPYGPLFTPSPSVTFASLLANPGSTTQLVPGGKSNGDPFWPTNYRNFAPSIGIAWQPFDFKTVIRAGYSISYTRDTLTIVTNVLTQNAGLHTGLAVSPTASDSLAVLNPSNNQTLAAPTLKLPTSQMTTFLNGFSSTGASPGIEAFDPNLRPPYVQQFSFGIQRELSRATALEVRYVGNHSTKLYRGNDLGQINLTPSLLSEFRAAADNAINGAKNPTPVLTAIGFLNSFSLSTSTFKTPLQQNEAGQFWYLVQSNCTNAFLKGTGCAGLGTFPANYFIANPITGIDRVFTNGADSRYDSLQVEVRRAFTRGLQVQGNYTWGKTLTNAGASATGSQSEYDADLDLRNVRFSRSRAPFDIRHTVHVNGVYQFPVGTGRRFLSHGIVGRILEGWQVGNMTTWRTGAPFSITSARGTVNRSGNSGTNPAVAVGVTDRNVCSSVGVYRGGVGVSYLPSNYYVPGATAGSTTSANYSVLTNPDAGSLGDHALRYACSNPNYRQIDMNVIKKVKLSERATFEFRAEFFNILNHPNFVVSGTGINSTGFGTATTSGSPREIQFNGRISF